MVRASPFSSLFPPRRMEPLIIVLLVSTLTTTGLWAIWVATSTRHWFLRASVLLLGLSPLLLIPAPEVFMTLVLQAAVVATGISAAHQMIGRWRGEQPERWRFSVTTVLLATALCGLASAVIVRASSLNLPAWQSIFVIGVVGGIASLLGYWGARRSGRWRRAAAMVAVTAGALLLAALAGSVDWFASSTLLGGYWPPQPVDPSDPNASLFVMDTAVLIRVWMATVPSISWLTAVVVWLAAPWHATARVAVNGRQGLRRMCAVMAVASAVCIAFPAACVLGRMLLPDPIPQIAVPRPNGYDDFIAAGRILEGTVISTANFDYSTAGYASLKGAAKGVRPGLKRAREGFGKPHLVPVDFTDAMVTTDKLGSLRTLARAFAATGRLAELDGDVDEALRAYLDAIRLGHACRRGGLIIDGLVGLAISGVGERSLYGVHPSLSPGQCMTAAAQLNEVLGSSEAFSEIEHRDRTWTQHAMGWHGRLVFVLEDTPPGQSRGRYAWMFTAEQARLQLLKAHLWLRAYQLQQGQLPDDWQAVESAGYPSLPRDPLDPTGAPLRYLRTTEGFLLYSVGLNGADEGGAEPEKSYGLHQPHSGDLRLDLAHAQAT